MEGPTFEWRGQLYVKCFGSPDIVCLLTAAAAQQPRRQPAATIFFYFCCPPSAQSLFNLTGPCETQGNSCNIFLLLLGAPSANMTLQAGWDETSDQQLHSEAQEQSKKATMENQHFLFQGVESKEPLFVNFFCCSFPIGGIIISCFLLPW